MTDEWYVILNMNCKYEICRRCPKSGLFKGSLKECDDWIKQKQKDEIKDKISMALKDPILQQGFEIICKENAELDCQMNRNKYCHSCVNATDRCFRKEIGCPCEKYKSYKDENAELEKENAELKDKLEILISVGNTCTKGLHKQLTKAKETEKKYVRNNAFTSMKEQGLFPFGKWHKVADEDLPKHEVNVLVLYNVQCIDIAHYNYDYKEWHFRDSIVRDVIAWCELPKFEE